MTAGLQDLPPLGGVPAKAGRGAEARRPPHVSPHPALRAGFPQRGKIWIGEPAHG